MRANLSVAAAALSGMLALGNSMAPSQRDIRLGDRPPPITSRGFIDALRGIVRQSGTTSRRGRNKNKFPPNLQSARECERRRRQMDVGMLNGFGR